MPFGYGFQTPEDAASEFEAMAFLVEQMLREARTNITVQVSSVTGDGLTTWPVVSVQPTVNQIDGMGNATPHGTIYNVPVLMIGGGNGAVISLPVVGDKGWMAVADRDISSVQNNDGAVSNPGSNRIMDLSDGLYIGKVWGKFPTQYVQFTATGINMVDMNGNKLQSGPAGFNVITAPGGDFVVNGVSATLHIHGGVTTGGGSTTPPVPGT